MAAAANKVIEAMKEAFDIFAKMELPIEERECTVGYDSVIALINGFEQLEAAAPKWISVEERLPDGDDKVLVSYLGYVNIAFYRWDHVFELPNTVMIDPHKGNITHWMPLPEPPKEE